MLKELIVDISTALSIRAVYNFNVCLLFTGVDYVFIISGVMRLACRPARWIVSSPSSRPCTRRTLSHSSSATALIYCWSWRHGVPTTTARCLNNRCHSASSRSAVE